MRNMMLEKQKSRNFGHDLATLFQLAYLKPPFSSYIRCVAGTLRWGFTAHAVADKNPEDTMTINHIK